MTPPKAWIYEILKLINIDYPLGETVSKKEGGKVLSYTVTKKTQVKMAFKIWGKLPEAIKQKWRPISE